MLYHTISTQYPISSLSFIFSNSGILAVEEDDIPPTDSIKVFILYCLREKFADSATNILLDMALLVDPRFKTAYIEEDKVEEIKCSLIGDGCNAVLPGQS